MGRDLSGDRMTAELEEINFRLSMEVQRLQHDINNAICTADLRKETSDRYKMQRDEYKSLLGIVLDDLSAGIPRPQIIGKIATHFADPNAQSLGMEDVA